jgi:ABC-type multidrug transport system fused ATPase/permease subunit
MKIMNYARFLNHPIARCLRILSKKERLNIFFVILIQILLGFLDLIGVLLLGVLGSLVISGVSKSVSGDRTNQALHILNIGDKNLKEQVIFLAILSFVLLVTKTLFSLFLTRKSLFFLSHRAASISASLTAKLLSQSILFVQTSSIQKTIHTLTNGVTTISVGIIGALVYLASDLALLVVLFVGLFIVDPIISISTLFLFSFVSFGVYKSLNLAVKNFGKEQMELSIKSSEKITEVISSYRELVVKNRRNYYSNQIGEIRHKLADSLALNTFYQNLSKYILEITTVTGVLLISAIQFSTQSTSHAVGIISIFLVASARIGPAVMRVQGTFLGMKTSIGSAEPALDLIDQLSNVEPIKSIEKNFSINYEGFNGEIKIKNLTFSYPGTNFKAVDNVSLDINAGSIVALVGPSGAGKSTLVDLILGILKPDFGTVNISNLDINEVIAKWPGAISYVPQDILIINESIADNVSMGYPKDSSTLELVNDAVKVAQLEDFVDSLPKKIETNVGDRGTKISGGQRQRIGIARAMFTKPKLLILDEATSSLDGLTEFNISKSIQIMRGSVTVIMIAHRLSSVKNSDQIIYLENGKIIATGSFEEVRKKVPNFDKQAKLMTL